MTETLVCVKCKRDLPEGAFSASVWRNRFIVRCRECVAANKRAKHPTYDTSCARCAAPITGRKGNRLYCSLECRTRALTLRQYGLPADADLAMFSKQNGRCAACDDPLPANWSELHIDHDHETGQVRGLLHGICNKQLADDPEKQFRLGVYLARSALDLRDLCIREAA